MHLGKDRILSALSSRNPPVTRTGKQDKQSKEQKYQFSNKCRTNNALLRPLKARNAFQMYLKNKDSFER